MNILNVGHKRFLILLLPVAIIIAVLIVADLGGVSDCSDQPIIIFSYLEWGLFNKWSLCTTSHVPTPYESGFVDVSPDGNWLLFISRDSEYSPERLLIRGQGQEGNELEIPWDDNWEDNSYHVRWANDDFVSVRLLGEDGNISGIMLINPWTGEEQVIQRPRLELTDFYSYYNNDGSYAVFTNPLGTKLLLYALQENTLILELEEDPFVYISNPGWSSQGSQLAFIRSVSPEFSPRTHELFLLNLQGEQTQVTDLSSNGQQSSYAVSLSWSPDEQRIAFWWTDDDRMVMHHGDPPIVFRLAVLNLETRKITTFNLLHPLGGTYDLVWSPDSKSIAMITASNVQEVETYTQDMYILDVIPGRVELVAEDVSRITAWCYCAN